MSNLFEDKTTQSGDPDMKMATANVFVPRGDDPVRTSQTLMQLHNSRRADDAQSVVNLTRPRRGHGY